LRQVKKESPVSFAWCIAVAAGERRLIRGDEEGVEVMMKLGVNKRMRKS
jgi:hypothetical protein